MLPRNLVFFIFLLVALSSCIIQPRSRFDTDARLLEYSEFKQPGQGQMWNPDVDYTFRTNLTRARSNTRTLVFEAYKPAGLYILEVDAQTNIGIVNILLDINGTEQSFQLSSPSRILESFRREIFLEQADTLRLGISARFALAPEGTIRIRPRLYSAEDFD